MYPSFVAIRSSINFLQQLPSGCPITRPTHTLKVHVHIRCSKSHVLSSPNWGCDVTQSLHEGSAKRSRVHLVNVARESACGTAGSPSNSDVLKSGGLPKPPVMDLDHQHVHKLLKQKLFGRDLFGRCHVQH
eukprot:6435344-Amphidinium_carterae.1